MKTLTIELPDDVLTALEARRVSWGAATIEDAVVRAVRRSVKRFDDAAMEAELAKGWNGPFREFTDEVVVELEAEIDRRLAATDSAHG